MISICVTFAESKLKYFYYLFELEDKSKKTAVHGVFFYIYNQNIYKER